jgi:lipoprotein NlpD
MLAQINHINPTQLKVGQRLQVSEGQSVLKEGLDSDQEKNKKNTLTPLKPIFPEQSSLVWPHEGNLASSFKEDGDKGIVIVGHESDPILAIAAGKVLYAGSSLKGYGNLLIIKHDDHWISTYAHNKTLLVKEGQMVKRGQKIALMGKSDAPRIMLHFELRYQGKPLDPLLYLPSKQ